jgi:hypothetical protein
MTPEQREGPLSAEEEAELRWALGSPIGPETQPTIVLRRLLATLDAARDPRPIGEGLREAAQAVVDVWSPMVSANVPQLLNRTISRLHARLAATEPEPTQLGCGCLVGEHDNTIIAMRSAHPDIVFPADDGLLHFYASATEPTDEERT